MNNNISIRVIVQNGDVRQVEIRDNQGIIGYRVERMQDGQWVRVGRVSEFRCIVNDRFNAIVAQRAKDGQA